MAYLCLITTCQKQSQNMSLFWKAVLVTWYPQSMARGGNGNLSHI